MNCIFISIFNNTNAWKMGVEWRNGGVYITSLRNQGAWSRPGRGLEIPCSEESHKNTCYSSRVFIPNIFERDECRFQLSRTPFLSDLVSRVLDRPELKRFRKRLISNEISKILTVRSRTDFQKLSQKIQITDPCACFTARASGGRIRKHLTPINPGETRPGHKCVILLL